MAPALALPLSYRSRRSALIPNDVSLSPEEEVLVADRIGYRPVPPPGASESTWFATVTTPNWAPKPLKSQCEEESHDAAADPSPERTVFSRGCAHVEKARRSQKTTTENRNARALYDNDVQVAAQLDQEKSEATATAKAASRYRQLSWRIDIPHMSEVQPLGNRARPPPPPPTTSPAQYHPRPWTSVVRNAMPPRNVNIDKEKFSMGNLSPRCSSTIQAWGA